MGMFPTVIYMVTPLQQVTEITTLSSSCLNLGHDAKPAAID